MSLEYYLKHGHGKGPNLNDSEGLDSPRVCMKKIKYQLVNVLM